MIEGGVLDDQRTGSEGHNADLDRRRLVADEVAGDQLGRSDAAYPPSVQVELECGAQTSTLQFNDKDLSLRR